MAANNPAPFATRSLSDKDAERLKVLTKGSMEIPADLEGYDDDEALEIIQICWGCPKMIAQQMLASIRSPLISDAFLNPPEPHELLAPELEPLPASQPTGPVTKATRDRLEG